MQIFGRQFMINMDFFFGGGGIKISITVLNEILFQKMSILQLIGHVCKALHIVCVPVGRDPDMVLVIFFKFTKYLTLFVHFYLICE